MRSDNPGFVPDSPFSKQLPEEWLNFFKTFPKLELHCHLLGTTSKETFEELVAESGADVSQEEINNFYTRGRCFKNFQVLVEQSPFQALFFNSNYAETYPKSSESGC